MDNTQLGNRMKEYEKADQKRFLKRVPIVVRLDGRKFSKFCKGMQRPFDDNFREAMIEVTKYLVEQTNAIIGYTQSDEISLILWSDNLNGQIIFDGRVDKINSIFASLATGKFLIEMQKRFPEKVNGSILPQFDCRSFIVPNEAEATNALLWRELDCTKNSVSMVSQFHFSHKSLQKLTTEEQKEKLISEKNVNWDNDFTANQKRGTYVRKENIITKVLTDEEMNNIPQNQRPESNIVKRNRMVIVDMPPLINVINKVEVIFKKEQPEY